MKNKFLVWFLILVGGLGLGYAVYTLFSRSETETPVIDSRADWQPGRSFYRFAEELGLNEKQQEEFETLEGEYRQTLAHLYNELQEVNSEIIDQLRQEDPDTVYLNELSEKTGRLHTQLKQTTINHFMALRTVCTPEQALRLSGVLQQVGPIQRGMHRGEGRGPRRGWQNRNNQ